MHEHARTVLLVGVVARDVVDLIGSLGKREVVRHGGGHAVGGGAVAVLNTLVHVRVAGEVPADLGPGLVGKVHAQLGLSRVVLEGAGAPQEGHELLLLGVFHPCEEAVLGNATAERLEEVGEPDFTQVAHDLLERQPRHAGEELVGLLDAEHVVGVVQHERGGVVAVYVDARNVHAAGECEQVLQEHRVDGNHAVDLLAGTRLVQAFGKVCDTRKIRVEIGVGDAGRHAVGEQGVLLSGDITVHVGLGGEVGAARNKLADSNPAVFNNERTDGPRQTTRGAQLGILLRHEEVCARAAVAQHLREDGGDLVDVGEDRLGGSHGAGHLVHELLDFADVGLGQGVDGVDARGDDRLHILDGGNESLEHIDVHGAVGEQVAKLEVLELGARRQHGILRQDICLLHHAAHELDVVAVHGDKARDGPCGAIHRVAHGGDLFGNGAGGGVELLALAILEVVLHGRDLRHERACLRLKILRVLIKEEARGASKRHDGEDDEAHNQGDDLALAPFGLGATVGRAGASGRACLRRAVRGAAVCGGRVCASLLLIRVALLMIRALPAHARPRAKAGYGLRRSRFGGPTAAARHHERLGGIRSGHAAIAVRA